MNGHCSLLAGVQFIIRDSSIIENEYDDIVSITALTLMSVLLDYNIIFFFNYHCFQ